MLCTAMSDLTYKASGVDTEAQDDFTSAIGRLTSKARSPQVLAGVGGFAAAFAPDLTGMTRPVLISGTDGVGTKLKLAFETGIHNTIGIDLVAMCVNDILTVGAKPLFFLDYFAVDKLNKQVALQIIEGIVEGCNQAGCSLVGGETAELPGFYHPGEYDLGGFAVGIVDEPKMITGANCKPGDPIIGIPSSGIHSNGFSLVRKAIESNGFSLDTVYQDFDRPLGEVLLTPTIIYADAVEAILKAAPINAMAHITGGGINGNLPRVLPKDVHPTLHRAAIPVPPVYKFLEKAGIAQEEMWSVFNMGVGYIIVVSPENFDGVFDALEQASKAPFVIGRLLSGGGEVTWT
ncbi:MAG: Phosphoribosylformylglycinamidine cyclo-ligase [Deltaproteobacteria bacterium ADurb.Bin058]|mgnify:FL=1|jgi:phosphoribosylformylglycinamidine cyclo-ligase|nr:MAG: Phosphoribosylformylglycinamidine cyclo-ligase [Deltaproteobacteria bacterium ADurb.Bin058]HPC92952.1 phosphoribosylformylglycinamidine cyclo-ligase [Myxococcota bacterium]